MVGKGNLAVFEGSGISESGETTPTKIGVHAFDIIPYLHEFFEPIPIDQNFLMTMDYSPLSEREIWLFLRVAVSPKPEKPRPQKSVHMHDSSILTCINFLSRFRSIKFFDDHGL